MHNCRSKLFYFSCFTQPFRAFDIQSTEMQVKLSIYRLTCKNEGPSFLRHTMSHLIGLFNTGEVLKHVRVR